MSSDGAICKGAYGFEEVAGELSAVGQGDVKLKVRRGAAHRQTPHHQLAVPGNAEQRLGARERDGVRVVHREATGSSEPAERPLGRDASQCVPTGPARGIERLELDGGDSAQVAADDECVTATTTAAERPQPRYVARLEKDHDGRAGEGSLGVADHEFDCSRAQPAERRALAERRQAALHPAHQCASLGDIPDRPGGKPRHNKNRSDSDNLRHRDPDGNTNTRRGWRQTLREFLYGLFGYEITQQTLEIRASMETLFMLSVFGEMLGVPVLPPYYGLRLLPFVVPQIATWKSRVLRERELGSDHDHHLHGL